MNLSISFISDYIDHSLTGPLFLVSPIFLTYLEKGLTMSEEGCTFVEKGFTMSEKSLTLPGEDHTFV